MEPGLAWPCRRVWELGYSVTCYEGQHLAVAMGLGVPCLVLIAAGAGMHVCMWLGMVTCMAVPPRHVHTLMMHVICLHAPVQATSKATATPSHARLGRQRGRRALIA